MSDKLARNPHKPAERFVKWVEFAAEYSDLNELNLPYHEWGFLAYYSLDVILASLVVLSAVVALVFTVLRRVVLLLFGSVGGGEKLKSS